MISAFRRFNSTESTPVDEPVSANASEQSSVTSAVSSATESSLSAGNKDQEFRERIQPNNAIYVGNLLFEATPEDLIRVFSPFGEVKSVKIAQDSRGLSKGYVDILSEPFFAF